MKRLSIIIALLAVLMVQAQDKPELADLPRNAVTISPISFIMRTPTVSYEHKFSPRWALETHLSGYFPRGENNPDGVSLAVDARWYFGYAYPVAFFLEGGVYGAYAWMTRDVFTDNDGFDIHTQPYTYTGHHIRPSFMGGFRFQSQMGIFVELRVGAVYEALAAPDPVVRGVVARSWFSNYLGLKLGYAF